MTRRISLLPALAAFAFAAACATSAHLAHPQGFDRDGQACVGVVTPPGVRAVERRDESLLAKVLGHAGEGGLCEARVYEVLEPVRVYRVWDEARQNTYGAWWSFDAPAGPRDAYRGAYEICQKWSALDRMVTCTLKAGSRVAIGPGQSVDCGGDAREFYDRSTANQIFVPIERNHEGQFVEQCTVGTWPPAPSSPQSR